jgi:para-aminobenzoate synthetase / 4-amino-4-deoxychorismate lyase
MVLTQLARPFVLLEDRLDPLRPARLFSEPVDIVRCDRPDGVDGAFRRIEAGLRDGLHAAGFLAYELGYVLEPKLAPPEPPVAPLLWFGLFPPPRDVCADALDAAFAALGPPPPITDVALGHDRGEHVAKVRRVLALIQSGDIYQANLTFPIRFRYAADPLALYGALRVRQPVAHGGVVALEDATILSISPELFVEVCDGRAATRPMKGTAARCTDPLADAEARAALASDPKQRAENLMIVDLLRNDLARISAPGSVRVPALFTVETYPTFHALTSTVTARLRPGLSLNDQIAALFPCGSIVGAPKIRAAEIIRDLEAAPRGVYTGAIGAAAPGGGMAFNVAIRTAVIATDGRGVYGVGGGLVADSDPDAEYEEALLKAQVLTDLAADYGLIETFRWTRGGFARLDRHLDRLAASAAVLGFAFDRPRAQAGLASAAQTWVARPEDRRVRLLLSRDGAFTITDTPAAAPSAHPVKLGIARDRLDPGDAFLRHKTTRRDIHDRAFAEAAAAGLDEVVLLNRDGQVADGARNSVFAELDGRLITPPLAAGALPGVLRAALVDEARAWEGELTLETLAGAERLFIGNSLHGLRPAQLQQDSIEAALSNMAAANLARRRTETSAA